MAYSTQQTMSFACQQQRFFLPANEVTQKMTIGVPKEIMNCEFRVGLIPYACHELIKCGHKVMIETTSGVASGYSDAEYQKYGCTVAKSAQELYSQCQIIVKVCALQSNELQYVQAQQVIFAFWEFQTNSELLQKMMQKQAVCIAYEHMTTDVGMFPMLQPISEISGQMAVQQGMKYLEKQMGGRGMLLGSVAGVQSAKVLIFGGGVAAVQAARVACLLGASVTLMDICVENMRKIEEILPANCTTVFCSEDNISQQIQNADLVIGAAYFPMYQKATLVSKKQIALMKPGAVVVDLVMHQGGNFESSQITSWEKPTFISNNVTFFCVPNIASAVPMVASAALSNSVLYYIQLLASKGYKMACTENYELMTGLVMAESQVFQPMIAKMSNVQYTPVEMFLQHNIKQMEMQQMQKNQANATVFSLKNQLSLLQGNSIKSHLTIEA